MFMGPDLAQISPIGEHQYVRECCQSGIQSDNAPNLAGCPPDSGVRRFTAKLLAHGGLASWKATLRVTAD